MAEAKQLKRLLRQNAVTVRQPTRGPFDPNVLVHGASPGSVDEYVGVLRGARLDRNVLRYTRFERFSSPVVVQPRGGRVRSALCAPHAAFSPATFIGIDRSAYLRAMREGGAVPAPEKEAEAFAKALAKAVRPYFAKLAEDERTEHEHKDIHETVVELLRQRCQRLHVSVERQVVRTEGLRAGRQPDVVQYYPLLTTYAWPDAAVLDPFMCAIEIDRQPPQDSQQRLSHFKTCLMKAAVHTLSGRYDAVLFLYRLRRDAKGRGSEYLHDGSEYTRTLLELLRLARVVVEFV